MPPALYKAQPSAGAGTGLFATRDIADGEVIWEEERPLLAVLDSARLKEACSWCFTYVGEKNDDGSRLKVCTGCKILRFCDVVSVSWLCPSSRGCGCVMQSGYLAILLTFTLSINGR